ncbi:MAG: PAS domain S-box protein, partial [Bacteroidia bacterium]|nr:PAS domain S-box protein [Bacteroidia bacterium]
MLEANSSKKNIDQLYKKLRYALGLLLSTYTAEVIGLLAVIFCFLYKLNETIILIILVIFLLKAWDIFSVFKIKDLFYIYSATLKEQLIYQISITEGKYKTIIQNLHDIILITEPSGRVKYCSPSIQSRLGYTVGELVNQNIFELVRDEDSFFLENALKGQNKTNSFQLQIQHRDAEGRWLYFECTSNNMLQDPMVQGILLNLRDITDRKRQEEINREKEKAALLLDLERERAEREKQIIEQKNNELAEKNKIIEEKNRDISQSMNYAYRIQRTLFTDVDTIKSVVPDFFLFWRPRDIVSGDFYWFGQQGKYVIFAVADCTGHGIPAALMTMIGNSLLNQIVLERGVVQPDLILNQLHLGVRKMLKQDEKSSQTHDGMDIALISFIP